MEAVSQVEKVEFVFMLKTYVKACEVCEVSHYEVTGSLASLITVVCLSVCNSIPEQSAML